MVDVWSDNLIRIELREVEEGAAEAPAPSPEEDDALAPSQPQSAAGAGSGDGGGGGGMADILSGLADSIAGIVSAATAGGGGGEAPPAEEQQPQLDPWLVALLAQLQTQQQLPFG